MLRSNGRTSRRRPSGIRAVIGQLDLAGERLFQESPDLPAQLHRIRARMRRGYLRSIDRIGRAFSQLLAKNADALAELNTAGEAALAELERQSVPTAIMFLDACRLDLGQRLAGLLNKGEPVPRATVAIAAAPVPSVTALGMAFALPMRREALTVLVAGANSDLTVMAKDFAGDLARLDQRRQWLGKNLGIRDHLGIDEVLDGETLKKPSKSRKLIAVYGADFDRHDGELQLTGGGCTSRPLRAGHPPFERQWLQPGSSWSQTMDSSIGIRKTMK